MGVRHDAHHHVPVRVVLQQRQGGHLGDARQRGQDGGGQEVRRGWLVDLSSRVEIYLVIDFVLNPGCYVCPITYTAPPNQIQSLIQLSQDCEQSIQYDCLDAPLRNSGIDFGFWLDKDGGPQARSSSTI